MFKFDLEDVIGITCTGIVFLVWVCFGTGAAMFVGLPMLLGYAQHRWNKPN